ncbi:MAG: murein hydrolase activator EnvC [Pseudobdellovibrionaceae bacterium]
MKRLTLLIFSTCLIAPCLVHAQSVPVPLQKADPAHNAKREMAEQEKQVHALDNQLKGIKSDLSSYETELSKKAGRVQSFEKEVSSLDKELDQLEQDTAAAEIELAQNREDLAKVIVSLHKLGMMPPEAMYLAPENAEELVTSLTALKGASPVLMEKVALYQEKIDKLNDLRAAKQDVKEKLKDQKSELEKANQELSKKIKDRNASYEKTTKDLERARTEAAAAAARAKSINDLVQNLAARNAEEYEAAQKAAQEAAKKSKTAAAHVPVSRLETPAEAKPRPAPAGLRLPAQGMIAVGYGQKDNIGAKSQGVYIQTRPGALVVTPAAGTVRYTGEFKHYGQMVIVEHQKNYYSLIAGLGKIDTVVGQRLGGGEPIGQSSRSGSGSSPLYFELRQNTKPVDPLVYLKRL